MRTQMPSIAMVEAAISRAQCREDLVRMPREVLDPRAFDVGAGDVLDLTGTVFLHSGAVPGLLRLARRGPVRLRLVTDSQPITKLRTLLPDLLRPSLAREDEWVILCPA